MVILVQVFLGSTDKMVLLVLTEVLVDQETHRSTPHDTTIDIQSDRSIGEPGSLTTPIYTSHRSADQQDNKLLPVLLSPLFYKDVNQLRSCHLPWLVYLLL